MKGTDDWSLPRPPTHDIPKHISVRNRTLTNDFIDLCWLYVDANEMLSIGRLFKQNRQISSISHQSFRPSNEHHKHYNKTVWMVERRALSIC
jgi:hypothetical protein